MQRSFAALITVVAGCTPAATPAAAVAVDVSGSPQSLPRPARALPTARCRLATEVWRPEEPGGTPLAFDGQDAPYLYVLGGAAKLQISDRVRASEVPVAFEHAGVVVDARLDASVLPLSASRAVVFEGFAVPRPGVRLRWRGIGDGGLVLGHELRAGVEPDTLQAELSCSELTLDEVTYPSWPEETNTERGRWARLANGKRVPLALEPGGAPVAWLDGDRLYDERDDAEVSNLLREIGYDGSHSRIVWERPREILFGWIPGDALYVVEDDEGPEEPFGAGGLGIMGTGEGDEPELLRCRRDVTLLASVGEGPRRRIGLVKAGTVMQPFDRTDAASEVHVPGAFDDQGFLLGDEARLFAELPHEAGCGPTAPAP